MRRSVIVAAWVLGGALIVFGVGSAWAAGEAEGAKRNDLDAAGLAVAARQMGHSGSAEGKLLAACAERRFAADSAAGKLDWDQWLDLVDILGMHFSPETKGAVLAAVQKSLLADKVATANLTAGTLSRICVAFKSTSREAQAAGREAIRTWLDASDKYKQASAAELAGMLDMLRMDLTEGKDLRDRLGAHVRAQKYFTDAKAMAEVGGRQWFLFSLGFGRDMPADARAEWAKRLRGAFVERNRRVVAAVPDKTAGQARLRCTIAAWPARPPEA